MELEVDFTKLLSNQILNRCNMHLGIEKNKKISKVIMDFRINAASRDLGVSYSSLIHGLAKNNIELDRKILSDIAINDSASFEAILKKATS